MLKLELPGSECYNETDNEFLYIPGQTLMLEHSLLSVSKWESKWHRSFLNDGPKTWEETVDYIRCMTVNKNIDSNAYNLLRPEHVKKVTDYINEPMTATTVKNRRGQRLSKEIVTSEVIYYWMTANGIPFECEKWHLNRLLMLIRVCSEKNGPGQKMSQRENMQQMHALNAARKAKMHTRG